MLDQPRRDLIRSLLVVNLGDNEGSLRREQAFTAAQNVELAAFHVNFDQLRYWPTRRYEIIQRHRRNINQALRFREQGVVRPSPRHHVIAYLLHDGKKCYWTEYDHTAEETIRRVSVRRLRSRFSRKLSAF